MRGRATVPTGREHVFLGTDTSGGAQQKWANMATEGCIFAHPPSARARAVWLTAARLTTPWPCSWPLEKSLHMRPSACSTLYGRRDLPVTQWAPGVKSVAWRNSVIDFTRASNLSPGPASGNLLHHRNAKSISSSLAPATVPYAETRTSAHGATKEYGLTCSPLV